MNGDAKVAGIWGLFYSAGHFEGRALNGLFEAQEARVEAVNYRIRDEPQVGSACRLNEVRRC